MSEQPGWDPQGKWKVEPDQTMRARNWGIVCGFGYGYAAALLTFMILISLH